MSTETILRVQGREPLLFGDGRPFSSELGSLAARSLPLPLPGTLAGFVRTALGRHLGWDWDADGPALALGVPVYGPLLARGDEPVFAAPADALVLQDDGAGPEVVAIRPGALPNGSGCLLPDGLLPLVVEREGKPLPGYTYWRAADLWRWLASPGAGIPPERIAGPPREERVHVAIDPTTGTAREGMLFSTEGMCLGAEWSLLARVEDPRAEALHVLGTFGGERRLARMEPAGGWPEPPAALREALSGAGSVRLLLATPAAFAGGWSPGWLDDAGTGSPPGIPDVTLRLRAAAVKRRQAVSGWDLRRGRGPKPVRWLAPAGSVYFFDVLRGDPERLADAAWLSPVSDDEQDRRDGYGLALWGAAGRTPDSGAAG